MPDITSLNEMITTIGIFFADTSTPTAYTYMCGMNGRSLSRSRERKSETAVFDCGPGAELETISSAGAKDWTISGDASMHLDTFDFLNTWMEEGGQRNIRIVYYKGPKSALVAHGYIQGTANLTQFDGAQSDAEGIATGTITINKAGPSTYTEGAPA